MSENTGYGEDGEMDDYQTENLLKIGNLIW